MDVWQGRRLRLWVLLLIILFLLLLLCLRTVFLVTSERAFLLNEGQKRVEKTVNVMAKRGQILDRHGVVLAKSIKRYRVSIDPQQFKLSETQWRVLASVLHESPAALKKRIKRSKRKYLVLATSLGSEDRAALQALPGLQFAELLQRFYFLQEATAPMLGYVNHKGQGVAGVEQQYDDVLQARDGVMRYRVNGMGQMVESMETVQPQQDGSTITLTIDANLQAEVYRVLTQATHQYQATAGLVLITDVQSGDILTMVSTPSFNPNSPIHADNAIRRNPVVQTTLEPGSTIKPIWLAWLMNQGLIQASDKVRTSPGKLLIEGKAIEDVHDFGTLSLPDILAKSSNVAMAKLLMKQPHTVVDRMMQDMKMAYHHALGLPGEMSGYVNNVIEKSKFSLAVSGFGYGLAVTPLELLRAYQIIANRGMDQPPRLFLQQQTTASRVLKEEVADRMIHMLQGVVEQGTARRARIRDVSVAGKTGTAHQWHKGQYSDELRRAFFVGFVPSERPSYIALVILDDPKGDWHYGGTSSAPLFAEVMERVLAHCGFNTKEVRNNGT